MAYISDKRDFYSGDRATYQVKNIVVRESANPSHYELLKFLAGHSFMLGDMPYADLRAATSILVTMPMKATILMAYHLYREEVLMASNYPSSMVVSQVSPLEITNLVAKCLGIKLPPTHISIMNNAISNKVEGELSLVLGVDASSPSLPYKHLRVAELLERLGLDGSDMSYLCQTYSKERSLELILDYWGYTKPAVLELKRLLV